MITTTNNQIKIIVIPVKVKILKRLLPPQERQLHVILVKTGILLMRKKLHKKVETRPACPVGRLIASLRTKIRKKNATSLRGASSDMAISDEKETMSQNYQNIV